MVKKENYVVDPKTGNGRIVAFIDEEEAYSKKLYPKGHPLREKHNISTAKGGKKKKKA